MPALSQAQEVSSRDLATMKPAKCFPRGQNRREAFSLRFNDMHFIWPKGGGAGIMISDFVDEYNGYLRLTAEKHEDAFSLGIRPQLVS